jgi:DNA-binding Lrp family transcriptional regulator
LSGRRKACAAGWANRKEAGKPAGRGETVLIRGIDEIDNRLVNLLLEDGRMSYSDLAERVGLSRTAVKTRVAALERSGVIKGYRAMVDPQAAPEMMIFVMNIETRAEDFEECKRIFTEASETVTIVQTTGNCHLVAICLAPDIRTMRAFVNRIYNEVPGILSINANAVLDVVKGSILPEK